jgi:hypothetical protein
MKSMREHLSTAAVGFKTFTPRFSAVFSCCSMSVVRDIEQTMSTLCEISALLSIGNTSTPRSCSIVLIRSRIAASFDAMLGESEGSRAMVATLIIRK